MSFNSQREFINQIRREKFGIGTTRCNPLAGMLHEAIVHLSAQLYQKDIHFISELLQNAEDNVYGKGVSPSLELVLTTDDIAKVEAQATLVLFNNEVGFQPAHVEALCAVGLSTKKGKRDSGYIGEKGIGFKSVFLVTRTPYIISNGYRFRFTDEASHEAKIGYVVPEWIDVPTEADLRRLYGKQQLPQTMIILPLRPDKIEPVRTQLKQISPESLLFLSKLRQLTIREESQNSLCITRSDFSAAMKDDVGCKVATVKLSVGSNVTHVSEECNYSLRQQQFRVSRNHRVDERKEVENWDITIAFPLRERINPGRISGDIYAFLPSYLASGFPFVINADFLLVASRETLKFDSPWNIGILSCIPTVFLSAFTVFLQKSNISSRGEVTVLDVSVREAYRYIPVKQTQNEVLRKVQHRILDLLKHEDCVLVDLLVGYNPMPSARSGVVSNMFCKPEMARLIRPEFRSILVAANTEGNLNPVIRNSQWYVVDSEVQDNHTTTLQCIGVPPMTETEYMECLKQEDWLLSLSDELYWEVVCLVLKDRKLLTVPVLKYCKEDGSIALASVTETLSDDGVKIYLSPSENSEWLSKWTPIFKRWISILFMPTNTVQTLNKLKQKLNSNVCDMWTRLVSVVQNLSVKTYSQQLLAQLATADDPKFIILATEFLYQCIEEDIVEMKDVSSEYPLIFVNHSQQIRKLGKYTTQTRVLLPAYGSMWPKLSLNSWSTAIIAMSDNYINPPSAWTPYIANKENCRDLESYRLYLRKILGASDLPEMIPPFDAQYQMPKHISSNFTFEQADLLLQWLINCQENPYIFSSPFFQRLKETEWLPTEEHGLRRPSSCFQKSSFSAFFKSSDLPWVHPYLMVYSLILGNLGVVRDIEKGCDAVVNYVLEISNGTTQTHSCDLEQAIRFYAYLQKFGRTAVLNASQKLKILVEGTTQNFPKAWKEGKSCVIHNTDGLFGQSLTVLDKIYPKKLLPFFAEVLAVPMHATVERYCQLWLKWRSDVHQITMDECTQVWKILTEKWESCDDKTVWKEFVAKAWVPLKSEVTHTFQLSSPSACFIPDDLHLLSLFSGNPNVRFVWYPDNTQKVECALNKVYAEMGVKKLSECVHGEFIISEDSGREYFSEKQQAVAGNGILCPGLFIAILGFLARNKYGLSSSERQSLLITLKGVAQITITRPLTRSYRMSCISPPVTVTQDNVMAVWSKTEGKLYCLDSNNPILRSSLDRRKFRVQLASTISLGLLSEHPLVADDLTEFLIGLLACGFESSEVEYELRRKNTKLYEEDELFLQSQLM